MVFILVFSSSWWEFKAFWYWYNCTPASTSTGSHRDHWSTGVRSTVLASKVSRFMPSSLKSKGSRNLLLGRLATSNLDSQFCLISV